MKKIMWKLEVLHPLTQNIIQTTQHKTLKDIGDKHPIIPFNTWRNIAIGRSKVYNNFVNLEKIIIDDVVAPPRDDNNNVV